MNIEEREIEFCDISTIGIEDIFPNPNKEQKKIWERITDEYGQLDGCMDNHLSNCIEYVKYLIKENEKELEYENS